MTSLEQQIEKRRSELLSGNTYDLARASELWVVLGLVAEHQKTHVVVPRKQLEERFEQIYDKMNKEQDKRLTRGENGRFPYYFMEAIMRDLEKELIEAKE